jgi:hypothetical protein
MEVIHTRIEYLFRFRIDDKIILMKLIVIDKMNMIDLSCMEDQSLIISCFNSWFGHEGDPG